MENLPPPPEEKDLPSPSEKLLRSPTFFEKYGKATKWLVIIIILIPLFLYALILFLKPQKPTTQPPISITPTITPKPQLSTNQIEISADKKEIRDAQTKATIFSINFAKEYLQTHGLAYNPDTFQSTNAKYNGECFLDTSLSNSKKRIVFSTGCLSGDLPQPWIGVYGPINIKCPPNALCRLSVPAIKFLVGGSGRNFVWSQDDSTITYEATLGLSGQTQTRTIDSQTGDILNGKPKSVIDTSNWKTYRNKKYGFEFKYPPLLKTVGNDEEILGSYGGQSTEVLIRIVSSQPAFHESWTGLISRQISAGQINAIGYYSSSSDEIPKFVYISLPNQKYVEIFAEINFPDAGKNFSKILSSFKFIE